MLSQGKSIRDVSRSLGYTSEPAFSRAFTRRHGRPPSTYHVGLEADQVAAVADLRELYRRIVFSILTGNTDDHLRNHGFLRHRRGWVLSPAYDLNPNPDAPDQLSTAIDLDDTHASIETALAVSG